MYGKVNEDPIMKQVFGGKKKMARKSKRKIVKVDDCQRTLSIRSPSTSVSAMTVQVPDLLMRANRRQYQQARCYDLQVQIAETGSATAKTYEIYTLSNAWWVKKSIEFAKAVWTKATKDERHLLGNRRAKWNDFIIFAGESGTIANYADLFNYSPDTSGDDMSAAEVTADETLFESQTKASEVEGDQDLGAEYEYGFSLEATDVTGGVRSYNIFDQYLLTRQHVTPADTRDAPYKDLMVIDQSVMDNLKQDGDNAPFDLDAFPSPWVLADSISADNGPPQGRFISKMISAPLGIVIIKKLTSGGAETNWGSTETMLISCKKGNYKGVHAPAYRAAMELC